MGPEVGDRELASVERAGMRANRCRDAGAPALKNEIALLSAEAASSAISNLPNYRSSP